MNYFAYLAMPIEKNKRTFQILLPIGAPYSECIEVFQEAIAEVEKLIADEKARNDTQQINDTIAPEVSE